MRAAEAAQMFSELDPDEEIAVVYVTKSEAEEIATLNEGETFTISDEGWKEVTYRLGHINESYLQGITEAAVEYVAEEES